jgi:hypothetical protein
MAEEDDVAAPSERPDQVAAGEGLGGSRLGGRKRRLGDRRQPDGERHEYGYPTLGDIPHEIRSFGSFISPLLKDWCRSLSLTPLDLVIGIGAAGYERK